MTYKRKIDVNPGNSIGAIIAMVMVFVLMYFIAKGIFTILSWLAPVLLIATAIINYKVLVSYGNWIVNLFKSNWIYGTGASILTVIGFPIVAGFLFAKALLYRKVDQLKDEYETQTHGELIDYEVVDEDPIVPLELPPIKKAKPQSQQTPPPTSNNNDYEQFFE